MNNILTLLTNLIPIAASVAPGVGQVQPLVLIAVQLVAYIQQQSGMTTDEILDRATKTLDDNEAELLKDKIRLELQLGGSPPNV